MTPDRAALIPLLKDAVGETLRLGHRTDTDIVAHLDGTWNAALDALQLWLAKTNKKR